MSTDRIVLACSGRLDASVAVGRTVPSTIAARRDQGLRDLAAR